jgi:hypothetical protein
MYHAYDDMCESLRKQIHAYQGRIEREARTTKVAAPKR